MKLQRDSLAPYADHLPALTERDYFAGQFDADEYEFWRPITGGGWARTLDYGETYQIVKGAQWQPVAEA